MTEDGTYISPQWIADAEKARSRPVWVCFEEPSDPLVATMTDLADPGWPGNAKTRTQQAKEHAHVPYRSHWGCHENHPQLGCGWFMLVACDEEPTE